MQVIKTLREYWMDKEYRELHSLKFYAYGHLCIYFVCMYVCTYKHIYVHTQTYMFIYWDARVGVCVCMWRQKSVLQCHSSFE